MVERFEEVCGEYSALKWFNKEITWKVGVGDKIRFWEDTWINGESLINMFWLFLISDKKNEVVGRIRIWREDNWWKAL